MNFQVLCLPAAGICQLQILSCHNHSEIAAVSTAPIPVHASKPLKPAAENSVWKANSSERKEKKNKIQNPEMK
jgi:hypothetical protein